MALDATLRRARAALAALWARPATPKVAHLASTLAVLAVLSAYLTTWLQGNWGTLTDPLLQNDDARTSLFPFHRYGPEGALADDPIATESMKGYEFIC